MDAITIRKNSQSRTFLSHACCVDRRGVLLLVVLSVLTLFLLLGATYIAVARRARMASKAFANNVTATAAAGVMERKLLEDAFLTVVRGTKAVSAPDALRNGEDLLGDKYGHNALIKGKIESVSNVASSNAILQVTPDSGTSLPSAVADLNGRVITFLAPNFNVSTRVLQVTREDQDSPVRFIIPAGPTVGGAGITRAEIANAISSSNGCEFIINGREFSGVPNTADTNESYDGFDNKNPLLARVFSTEDYDGDGQLSFSEDDNDNGLFDRDEDVNDNGVLDPGEDFNGNGVLDTVEEDDDTDGIFDVDEDLDNDGELDSKPVVFFAPLYPLSEDADGDGILDAGEDDNGNGQLDIPVFVDSDSDGVSDSQFIDIGLPDVLNNQGKRVYPLAAMMVVDLDGRLNLNTQGSQVDVDTIVDNQTAYPVIGSPQFPEIPMENIPRGSGVGPADVSLMRSFSPADDAAFGGSVSASENHQDLAKRPYVSFGGFYEKNRVRSGPNGTGQDGTSQATREVPETPTTVGRFDDGPWNGSTSSYDQRPGIKERNDVISQPDDQWWAELDDTNGYEAFRYFTNPGRWGSPADLKGRLRIWADPQTGQPVYYKPYWDDTTNNARIADNEVVDDPYEVQLANRLGSGADDLLNPAELEGLLRYYDSDSLKLSRRLVQLTEYQAAANRNLFTTESWDTSAITGTAWSDVIGTPFGAFLRSSSVNAPQRAVDVFSPEIVAGQKMDINRPFHDSSFTEPNDATGIERRQLLAKQFYCLMCAVAYENDSSLHPFTPEYAEMIAQYAVNIVDFRDADSVMTRFNYDPSFLNTFLWNPPASAVVWGCERPELLITETLAWHDRRTDDLSSVGTADEEDTSDPMDPDNDFDQLRRPRGAFFVELTSPWQSKAQQYAGNGGVGDVTEGGQACRADPVDSLLVKTGAQDTDGDGHVDAGEDVDFDGSAIDAAPGRFSLEARVDLSRASGSGNSRSPTWRLVSVLCGEQVDGGTALGQDPLVDVATNPNDAVLDPARPGSNAIIDRAFYFTVPGSNVQNALPGRNFWQDAAHAGGPNPKLHQYVVAGTDAPFDFNEYDLAHPQTRVFVGPNGQPGTLTEPFTSGSDPYEELMNHIDNSQTYTAPGVGNNYVGSWNNGYDVPFDSITRNEDLDGNGALNGAEDVNENGVLDSLPVSVVSGLEIAGGNGEPLLMHNGTHENFSIIHLQRLANPEIAWNATTNPYITIDCMPVDLVVVNTESPPVVGPPPNPNNNNHDEPGNTGAPTLNYLLANRPYYDGPVGSELGRTVERGGKISAYDGPDTNQWSRRVDASITDLEDARAFLSTPVPAGSARPPQLGAYSVSMTNSLPGTFIHSFGSEDLNGDGVEDSSVTEDTDGDGQLDPHGGDLDEEDLDGNGSITVEGDTNGDGHFLTAAPQRFVDSTTYEPQQKSWLIWANRPYTSVNEIASVPWCSPFHLTRAHAADHSEDENPVTQTFRHLLGFFEDQNDLPSYSNAPASPSPRTFPWRAITGRNSAGGHSILDFLRVQSPFVGLEKSITGTPNTAALTAIGRDVYPIRQISNYRDPGKINVNTITDPRVWRSIFGDIRALGDPAPYVANYPAATQLPLWSPYLFGGSGAPATTTKEFFSDLLPPPNGNKVVEEDANGNGILDGGEDLNSNGILDKPLRGRDRHRVPAALAEQDANANNTLQASEDINGNGVLDPSDDYRNTDIHSAFRYQTLNRLQNLVTVRSNVYAVWITVGYFDWVDANNNGRKEYSELTEIVPQKRNRGFYIFDRSIPVAYERGEDHNVRDGILLRRIIQ